MFGLVLGAPPDADAVIVGVASSVPDIDTVHSVVVVMSDAVPVGSAWVCPDNASACTLFRRRSAFRRNMSSLRASTFEIIS